MPQLDIKAQEEHNDWKLKSIIIIVLLTISSLFIYSNLSSRPEKSTNMASKSDEDDTCPIPPPNLRTQFGSRATLVRGFPSTGGIYLLDSADPVELDFLALDRFHETPRSSSDDPAAEDRFCQRMRAIGAQWFESEWEADKQPPFKVKDGRRVGRMETWLGWPDEEGGGGGVWVLEVEEFEGARKGVGGRIRNAKSMEERCSFIERLGGVFYKDREDCEVTKGLTF